VLIVLSLKNYRKAQPILDHQYIILNLGVEIKFSKNGFQHSMYAFIDFLMKLNFNV